MICDLIAGADKYHIDEPGDVLLDLARMVKAVESEVQERWWWFGLAQLAPAHPFLPASRSLLSGHPARVVAIHVTRFVHEISWAIPLFLDISTSVCNRGKAIIITSSIL